MRALGAARLRLLAETWLVMLAARIALRLLPAHRILAWQQTPVQERGEPRERVYKRLQIQWAVAVVARRSPVALVCFPQCLAASYLLRQRGVASRLHYGVTREGGRLATHTWLESGGTILVGGEVKDAYATLGVY